MQPTTLCIIGNARSQVDNPIARHFSSFFITFIVDSETGQIVDAEVSVVLRTTNEFLRSLFVGRSLAAADTTLEEEVRHRYLGSSQKAIIVAYKDAVKKYRAWRNGVIVENDKAY